MEKNEIDYLNSVQDELDKQIYHFQKRVEETNQKADEQSKFLAEHFYNFDPEELAAQRGEMVNCIAEQTNAITAREKVELEQKSPYFGMLNFKPDDENQFTKMYIGIGYISNPNGFPFVLDWRSPACSMYYDYELGFAKYIAPMGEISGKISEKKQYKIEGRNLLYAVNSSLTIDDDILRENLSKSATGKMQEIVSTIQKEQNQIIRGDEYSNLLVQGVAGSGKTSIALHRAAFLIYKHKISSKDILILSPTSLFSEYIKDVLPELGEQQIDNITMEEITANELDGICDFESRQEMIENLLSGNDQREIEVNYKSSFEFLESLELFLKNLSNLSFHPKDIDFGKLVIKAETLQKLFTENYSNQTPAVRIDWICDYIIDQINTAELSTKALTNRIKKLLLKMFETGNVLDIYNAFLKAIGMPPVKNAHCCEDDNCNCHQHFVLPFEDITPILYIKDYVVGLEIHKEYKFMLIDEMQDLNPINFAILNKTYPCPKTILGDIYQSIEKQLDSKYITELSKFEKSSLVKLSKAYRSTVEISEFCQDIIGLTGAKNFSRHGAPVEKSHFKNFGELTKYLNEHLQQGAKVFDDMEDFSKNKNFDNPCTLLDNLPNYTIIANTTDEAEKLFFELENVEGLELINNKQSDMNAKKIIIPISLCKGLEFDNVICIERKKANKIQKRASYVACTRALHKLIVLTY